MVGWIAGWVDDSFRKYCHFVAPSCKLELARFSALLRIQDGAECGNNLFIKTLLVASHSSCKNVINLLLLLKMTLAVILIILPGFIGLDMQG